MLGIIIFVAFLVLGLAISNRVFFEENIQIRVWIGCLIGILGLMWCVVPFSFFLGFTKRSNILALILLFGFYLLIRRFYRQEGKLDFKPDGDSKVLYVLVISITVLISALLTTHVLSPGKDGGLYSGQSTFGDLNLHLGIVTSIATQGTFPPQYSIYPGQILSYPFLVDSLSSSLYLFGTPLRWSVLLPSYVMVALLVAGFFIFANEILKHKYASTLATILFFFNGGFGFIYFMDDIKKNPANFSRMFSEFFHTPTNYNEHNIRWSNTICDMIIPQRTTLAGWVFILPALWLLYRAVISEKRKYFIYLGIVAGLMPMIHTHSFLALGMISATWFFAYLFQSSNKKVYIQNWLIYGACTAILALPQLFYWTFPQSGAGGFVKLHPGWVNESDLWLWFWVKNAGLVFILLFPAAFAARRKMLSFYSGAITIFMIAELVIFQPNIYDNNKLFYIWYILSVILVSAYAWSIYKRMEGVRARWLLLAIMVFLSTFSAILTIQREAVSSYLLYDSNAVAAADFVKSNAPKDALFLTSDNHNNVISSLTGRNILLGTSTFLYFHGLGNTSRAGDIERMYKAPEDFKALAAKYKIDYVYYSKYEADRFKSAPDFFKNNYPIVFQKGDIMIFAISGRASGL